MEPLRMVPNLIEQVHDRLVDAIADGTLAPGERVTQEELADHLAVSRQPVSHALQLLKRQGLVVEHGRRGLSVAPVDPTRLRDLFQLRAAIEGLAARLAAERVARAVPLRVRPTCSGIGSLPAALSMRPHPFMTGSRQTSPFTRASTHSQETCRSTKRLRGSGRTSSAPWARHLSAARCAKACGVNTTRSYEAFSTEIRVLPKMLPCIISRRPGPRFTLD